MAEKIPAASYVRWLRDQASAKRPYWYGCCYDLCTKDKLREKAKQYPSHYTSERMGKYLADIKAGQIAADCVGGAIKGAAWTRLGTRLKQRNRYGCPDKSADGMFDYCKSQGSAWGEISTLPEIPCVAVRKAGHVGMYIGGGKVVEWMDFAHGCVMTDLKKRPWTHWYKLPWVDYGAVSDKADRQEPSQAVPSETTLEHRAVKGVNWRVRDAPSLQGKVLGYVSEGTVMCIYGEIDGWYGAKGGGLKGYISKDAFE